MPGGVASTRRANWSKRASIRASSRDRGAIDSLANGSPSIPRRSRRLPNVFPERHSSATDRLAAVNKQRPQEKRAATVGQRRRHVPIEGQAAKPLPTMMRDVTAHHARRCPCSPHPAPPRCDARSTPPPCSRTCTSMVRRRARAHRGEQAPRALRRRGVRGRRAHAVGREHAGLPCRGAPHPAARGVRRHRVRHAGAAHRAELRRHRNRRAHGPVRVDVSLGELSALLVRHRAPADRPRVQHRRERPARRSGSGARRRRVAAAGQPRALVAAARV